MVVKSNLCTGKTVDERGILREGQAQRGMQWYKKIRGSTT
jgi:hypothetical protein